MLETHRQLQDREDDRAERRANEFRAERRAEQQQRYFQRAEQPQQESNPIAHYIAIGVFATFPEARRWLLIACGGGLLLSLLLLGFVTALPGLALVIVGLIAFSVLAFLFLWIPSTLAAYVVPKMKDRWLGTEEEDEEEEDE